MKTAHLIGPSGLPLSSDNQRSVLVVDDDPDMCWILKVTIAMFGRSVTTAQSGRGALDVAHKCIFPLAFIDARLPDMDGLQLATKMVHRYTKMKIIIISGYYSEDDITIVEARQSMRVHGFVAKPFQLEAIEAALQAAI
jgi:DNA-binding NtrC family response regulator